MSKQLILTFLIAILTILPIKSDSEYDLPGKIITSHCRYYKSKNVKHVGYHTKQLAPEPASIDSILSTFKAAFTHGRNTASDEGLKDQTRDYILNTLGELGLSEVAMQNFEVQVEDITYKGVNIFARMDGRSRNSPDGESILLFGGHYDTV